MPRAAARRRRDPPSYPDHATQPFASASDAWFWFMACHEARLAGARVIANAGRVARPCEPADIQQVLLRLCREGRLREAHLRVLVHYGRSMMPPDPHHPAHRQDLRHWRDALAVLETSLRRKGIVA